MRRRKYPLIVMHRDLFTIDDVGARTNIHPELIRHFMDLGMIQAAEDREEPLFDERAVHRCFVIKHLRRDLGINVAGIAAILDLLDRLNALSQRGGYGHESFD